MENIFIWDFLSVLLRSKEVDIMLEVVCSSLLPVSRLACSLKITISSVTYIKLLIKESETYCIDCANSDCFYRCDKLRRCSRTSWSLERIAMIAALSCSAKNIGSYFS